MQIKYGYFEDTMAIDSVNYMKNNTEPNHW